MFQLIQSNKYSHSFFKIVTKLCCNFSISKAYLYTKLSNFYSLSNYKGMWCAVIKLLYVHSDVSLLDVNQ